MYTAIGQKIGKEIYYTHNIIPEIVTYLDGFQYSFNKNGSGGYIHNMQFFPTAEGYVNVLNKEEDDGGSFQHYFDYVYNYTDHLGNVRLSYTDANRDGTIANYIDTSDGYYQVKEILEENNYYPFGLKHKQYNSLVGKYALTSLDTRRPVASLNSETGYKYKYQGQERQDELNLNWDSFKWRNYDYALGRFMNIDPLVEEYHTWSPYVFSGNRVIDARELEGLEPHTIHKDYKSAAHNFGSQYNNLSIRMKGEIGTMFYKNQTSEGTFYSYTTPVGYPGNGVIDSDAAEPIPEGAERIGSGHTHGKESLQVYLGEGEWSVGQNRPSDYGEENGDIAESKKDAENNPNFEGDVVITPGGYMFIYGPGTKNGTDNENMTPDATDLPRDKNSMTNQENTNTERMTPEVLPIGVDEDNF